MCDCYLLGSVRLKTRLIFRCSRFQVLSSLSRGSVTEKVQWIFGLYDLNGDGFISRTEMLRVVSAIYDMLGHWTQPQVNEHTAKEHVDKIFNVSGPGEH